MSNRFKLQLASVLVATLGASHAIAQSGPCTSTITADINSVSVTAGGTQTITIASTPGVRLFSIVGSFAGTSPAEPNFAYGGLFLARDRYLVQSYLGMSPLIPGGIPHAPGGHQFFTNAQGSATQVIVVPPLIFAPLVGRTVRHGVYTLDATFLASCGSNTVPLTFTP